MCFQIRMKLTNISYYNSYQLYQNNKNTPSFSGYKSKFSKELDNVIKNNTVKTDDIRNLSKLLNKFWNRPETKARVLGSGTHGTVYKIDDEYVIKVPNSGSDYFYFEDLPKQKFQGLKTYYGEVIANFTYGKILKNVSQNGSHMQAGIPDKMISAGLRNEDIKDYYLNTYLTRFAKLPQRAYNAIACDFDKLNKMGKGYDNYTFDFKNPNNFVLVGKRIRITDLIGKTTIKNANSTAEMLSILLEKTHINQFAQFEKEAIQPRREIFNKIVLASMKYNLDLGTYPTDKIIWKTIINDLCGIKTSYQEVLSTLLKYQKEVNQASQRLKLTKNYLDSLS